MKIKTYTPKQLGIKAIIRYYFYTSFTKKSPLRVLSEEYLRKIVEEHKIKGKIILDIGGREKESRIIRKTIPHQKYIIGNISKKADIVFDATQNHPFKSNTVDVITSFNLIEHLKEYKTHIKETLRICKKTAIFFIPFSMYYHPDPKDYWRLTQDALEEEFKKYEDVADITIIPVSIGPFMASSQYKTLIYNKLLILKWIFISLTLFNDLLFVALSYLLKRNTPSKVAQTFPLGYYVIVNKR